MFFTDPRLLRIPYGGYHRAVYNEVTGINPKVQRRCDAIVSIPMKGYKNTINVATAFGIITYEILRRWKAI